MIEIRPAVELRATVRETYWIGDTAIDREQSSVEEWAATGEVAGLVVRPGQAPATIRWRPLTESEVIYLEADRAHSMDRLIDAFRLGLVAIDGVELPRIMDHRRSVLRPSMVDQLMAVTARFDWSQALAAWLEADPLFGTPWRSSGESEVSLPLWLGALILAATFRGRGR